MPCASIALATFMKPAMFAPHDVIALVAKLLGRVGGVVEDVDHDLLEL